MPRRPITRIFVVNPPVLGKQRRKAFEKQFQGWRKPPPPIAYAGVNKNHLDLGKGSEYRHLINDNRPPWVKLRLRLGWEKHAENFRQKYDPMLRQADWVTEVLPIGHLACTLSHIEVWKLCRDVPDDGLCMIVEDDALINPAIEFGGIEWPETADFLHLWPGGIGFYEKYSDDYVKIVPKWQPDRCNWTALGYLITPACARRFLAELIPYIVNRTVDVEMCYRGTPNAFAVRKPWVRPMHTTSLIVRTTQLHTLARRAAYRIKALFPESFRARHPFWLKEQEQQFDEPQLK